MSNRRTRAGDVLPGSDALLRLLTENAGLGIGLYDTQGKLLFFNTRAAEYMGGSAASFVGKTIFELYDRDIADLIMVRLQSTAASAVASTYEDRVVIAGTQRWFLSTYSRVCDESGAVVGVLIVSNEITERCVAAERARASQEFLRATMDALTSNIAILDEKGIILSVNAAWTRFGAENGLMGAGAGEGVDYLAVCEKAKGAWSEEAPTIVLAIRELLAGKRDRFELEYPCHSPDCQRWFVVRLTRFDMDGKLRVVVAHQDITERKKAEEALKASEERYRLLHESMMDAFVSVDMTGRIQEFNSTFQNLLGYPEAELKQLTYTDLTPEQWHAFEARIVETQILPRGYSDVYEKEYRRKDGTTFPVELRTSLIRDEKGRPSRMWAIVRDLTEKKKAEAALRESEVRHRTFIEASLDMVFLKDESFRYLISNKANSAFLGRPEEEIIGRTDFELMPRETAACCRASDQQALGTAEGVIAEEVAGARVYQTLKFPVSLPGGRVGVGGYIRDITERKQAEALLQEGRARYEAIFESTGTATLLVEEDGTILMANSECLAATGYSPQELIGTKWPKYVAPESLALMLKYHNLRREDPGKAPRKYEVKLVNKKSEIRNVILDIGMIPGTKRSVVSLLDITERKYVELAWQESEEKYRTLAETTPDIIWQLDLDLRFLYVNSAIEKVLGYAQEELVGRSIEGFFAADRLRQVQAVIERELRNTESRSGVVFETEMIHKTGRTVPLEIHGMVQRDEKGNPTGFQGVTRDITERKQAEEAVKHGQVFSKAIVDSIPGAFYVLDEHGRYARWNDYQRDEIVGKPENEIAGFSAIDTIHPDDRELIGARIANVLKNGAVETVEGRVLLRGGPAFRWLLMTGRQVVVDGKAFLVGTGVDITERKQVEEALRLSEEQLSNALQMARAGHWEYDVDSDTFTFNDNFYRIFRTTAAQVGGYKMSSADYARRFCHPDDAAMVARETRAAIESADPNFSRQIDHRILYADGQLGHITVRFFIVKDSQGRTVKTYGVNQDITGRKQTEEMLRESARRLREAEAMAQLGHWSWDVKTGRVEWSGEVYKIFRQDPEKFTPHIDSILALSPWPGDHERDKELIRRAMESREKGSYEQRFLRPDKSIGFYHSTFQGKYDGQGHLVSIVGTVQDITERKKAEEELHHVLSSARCILWHAVVTLPAGGGKMDWAIRISNEEAAEALLPLARSPGQPYSDVWHSGTSREDLDQMDRLSEQAIRDGKSGYTQEFRCRTLNGEVHWLSEDARIQPLASGRWLVVGVCMDVTARRETEERMKRQLEELRRWHEVTLGREERIAELKREVNELAARMGEKPKYGEGQGEVTSKQ